MCLSSNLFNFLSTENAIIYIIQLDQPFSLVDTYTRPYNYILISINLLFLTKFLVEISTSDC